LGLKAWSGASTCMDDGKGRRSWCCGEATERATRFIIMI
jgi:hypothetical protein